MIPLNVVFEMDPRRDHDFKMKHVGSGIGKVVGGMMAPGVGHVAGHYVGKSMPKNPDAKADISRAGHRMGITADKMMSMRQVKAAGVGSMLGAATGAALAAGTGQDPADAGGAAVVGGAAGAGLGAAGSQIKAGYKTAKKMGYGTTGRVGTAMLGPLATITTPKALKKRADARREATA